MTMLNVMAESAGHKVTLSQSLSLACCDQSLHLVVSINHVSTIWVVVHNTNNISMYKYIYVCILYIIDIETARYNCVNHKQVKGMGTPRWSPTQLCRGWQWHSHVG